jgi:hypothetical protein
MHEHKTASGLTAFLYELLRDHVVCGNVEGVLKSQEEYEAKQRSACEECQYVLTNGYLAQYAEDVAERLIGHERRVQADRLSYEIRRSTQLKEELAKLQKTLDTDREALVAFLRSRINQQKSGLAIPSLSSETRANMQLEVDLVERYLELILQGKHHTDVSQLGGIRVR